MEMIAAELVETGAKKDARGRRLVVRAEAKAAVAAYERSGLTQREFAKQEGIKFFTFTGWLRRYRPAGGKPAFAEVRVAQPAPQATAKSKLTVKLPSGLVIRGTDGAAMADLIKRLGC
jgi:transposase-like protein